MTEDKRDTLPAPPPETPATATATKTKKKPYTAPVLRSLGKVNELTGAVGSPPHRPGHPFP